MEKLFAIVGAIAVVLFFVVLFGLLLAIPTYFLWNGCLVGAVTGVNEITWLQAWGLNILFGVLFKAELSKK
jgi:hypothetical protein